MSQARESLIAEFRATRVSFIWFGVRKSLSAEQRAEAAETFGAEGPFLSAGKKLIDTKHKAYRQVTGIRTEIRKFWQSCTLPFPEPGVRLIKEGYIPLFDAKLRQYRDEMRDAVRDLDERYHELRQRARERLGRLYNSDDYPRSLEGLFHVDWEFPAVEAPDYLRELNPELYEAERARVIGRFEEAVRLAEDAFLTEFTKLVGHLTDRLSGDESGQPKTFRDSAVGNLVEFFDRFRHLSVRSNEQLDSLVEQVQGIVRGVTPEEIRGSDNLRRSMATNLSAVAATLDGLMIDRPRRRLDRRRPTVEQQA
jgi:hypothetical protein